MNSKVIQISIRYTVGTDDNRQVMVARNNGATRIYPNASKSSRTRCTRAIQREGLFVHNGVFYSAITSFFNDGPILKGYTDMMIFTDTP